MGDKWLEWAKKIQSLSQAGLTFSKDVYDRERYEELRNLSAEIMQTYTGMELTTIKDLFTSEAGYQTPKVDVRGVVFKNGQILMVKENNSESWSLPGGFCDVGLSPSENVVKEMKEEAGFDVIPIRLLALLDKNKHPHPPEAYHFYKIFILCEIIGGTAAAGIETNDVQFFSESSLPNLSVHRNTESQIKMLFECLRHPEQETIFD